MHTFDDGVLPCRVENTASVTCVADRLPRATYAIGNILLEDVKAVCPHSQTDKCKR